MIFTCVSVLGSRGSVFQNTLQMKNFGQNTERTAHFSAQINLFWDVMLRLTHRANDSAESLAIFKI